MTRPAAPALHPKRCETCDHHSGGIYFDRCKGEIFPDNMDSAERQYIRDWICSHGCASHSSTPDADARQRIEDVVKELEEKKARYDKRANSTTDFSQHTRLSDIAFGIDLAIALLKDRVERK